MKKILIILSAALLMAGCTRPTEPKQEQQVDNPVMPVHYTGGTMTLTLTDYLPGLTGSETLTFITDEHYMAALSADEKTLQLTGDNTLSVLCVNANDLHCDIPILPRLATKQALITTASTDTTVELSLLGVPGGEMKIIALLQDRLLPSDAVQTQDDGRWTVKLPGESHGRTFLRVYAATDDTLYNDILIPLQDGKPVRCTCQLGRHDDQAQVLYSVLVDRFFNGNTQNDWKINSPEVFDIVDYQGGDLAGITKKIKSGYFDSLGINTLWISPITQNPWDAWGCYRFEQAADSGLYNNKYDATRPYTRFSGYHGYWPIYATAIDSRFGTPDELRSLLTTAHAHNINVVLDYVANHMHISSPTLQAHPDWHTDSILPDGRRNFELWDEARLTTWFDVHIPTLDLEREDVYLPMTDSALYWLENYDFDGFRHDACKHIPECYWRTLTHKAVSRFPNRHIWMIGETYGSPELINTYVKTGMLNAQFDFNVYFTAVSAFTGRCGMQEIDRVVRESAATYGCHHTMGNISGNHDQARIASVMGGAILPGEDTKTAGWSREVGLGDETAALRKASALQVMNMTLPGVPCIYQGDEYAEAGGNDPDNRLMMRFDGLNEKEQAFKKQVAQLISLRRHSMPLLYGEYIPVLATEDTWTYRRVYLGESVEVTIRQDGSWSVTTNDNIHINNAL